MEHIIQISDMNISSDISDRLITYSLGSCLGLTLWDKRKKIGGMVHCLLPLSKADPVKAINNPHVYVDTGVSALLKALFDMGATRDNLIAKIAGCASVVTMSDNFKIGKRNEAVARKVLWKNNILVGGEQVGGTIPRTLAFTIGDGVTIINPRSEATNF